MWRIVLAVAPAYLLVTGCALPTGRTASEPVPGTVTATAAEVRFARTLNALELGLYPVAFADLLDLYRRDPAGESGQRALLILAANELDPRNPVRRPEVAARLAGDALSSQVRVDWMGPLFAVFYLLALEYGAPPANSLGADPYEVWPDLAPLPVLPTTPWPERLSELDQLAEQVADLEQEREALRRDLTEKTRELERIRRTLRP